MNVCYIWLSGHFKVLNLETNFLIRIEEVVFYKNLIVQKTTLLVIGQVIVEILKDHHDFLVEIKVKNNMVDKGENEIIEKLDY